MPPLPNSTASRCWTALRFAPAFSLPIDAAALAAEPTGDNARLFIIRTETQTQYDGLRRYEVVTLPLADLHAEPQSFGVTAAEPFSSLFDLAVAPNQHLLYVGYADTSGSPNRHYRTYKAYDLQSGEPVDLPIEQQPASIALHPAATEVGISAISYDWLGYAPSQHRIYLVTRGDGLDAAAQPIEDISGPAALAPAGAWLYVVRPRGLWVLQHAGGAEFTLVSVIPFVTEPPADIRVSPDGSTLYLLGEGWLTALPAAGVQSGGIEQLGPFPNSWLGQGEPLKQMARRICCTRRRHPRQQRGACQPPAVGRVVPQRHRRPHLAAAAGRAVPRRSWARPAQPLAYAGARPGCHRPGRWREDGMRSTLRSLDAGATWQDWAPPIAYAAGSDGARTLYTAGAVSPQPAEPRPLPNGGSSENPAWVARLDAPGISE